MDRSSAQFPLTRLEIAVDTCFVPLLTAYVEHSALAFGLDEPEALNLTLAAEEMLTYLARQPTQTRTMRVECEGQGYQVRLSFCIDTTALDLRWLNLTSSVALDTDGLADEVSLLIASRVVDRLQLSRHDDEMRLALIKEKVYPATAPSVCELPAADPAVSCRAPDAAELSLVLQTMNARTTDPLPQVLTSPGKMLGMVAAGAYEASIAVDSAGRLAGVIFWHWRNERLAECLGPYLFDQPLQTSRLLLDHLLARLARSKCLGLLNQYPPPQLPEGFFEVLGALRHLTPAGAFFDAPVRYRDLEEDVGGISWTHARLRPFLAQEYARLAFARDLYGLEEAVETSSPNAVLTAVLNRTTSEVTLSPLWWGADAHEVLQEHVRLLSHNGLRNLCIVLDLGRSWQARFGPAALDAGFEPKVVLPNSGRGDLLILQRIGDNQT